MTTVDDPRLKLCAWAQSQVGTHEGENNWNKYAAMQNIERLYGGRIQNVPWCDIFTDAVFVACFGLERGAAMTYQTIGGGSALCQTSADYFRENGAWIERGRTPDPGDVIFFYVGGKINHMGIVTRVSGGTVWTVEGNISDMVGECCYNINDSSIAGYGRPKWELVTGGSASTSVKVDQKEGKNKIMNGVDISQYQRGLTIQQIQDAGNGFAIIKVTEGSNLIDSSAFDFYLEAYNTGFPLGAYCYSHALTMEQAMAEGAFLLKRINGFPMPCGIFLDIEEQSQLALSKDQLLAVIRGWCASIGGAGYIPGVYGSAGNLWAKISPDDLPDGTLVWVAQWSASPPAMRCDVWQNSDSGRIDGYNGPVDTDVSVSEYFRALVSIADYKRGEAVQESAEAPQDYEGYVPDACPIGKPDPLVMCLQLVMSYDHKWGKPDGQKTAEFFTAVRKFIDDLEKS